MTLSAAIVPRLLFVLQVLLITGCTETSVDTCKELDLNTLSTQPVLVAWRPAFVPMAWDVSPDGTKLAIGGKGVWKYERGLAAVGDWELDLKSDFSIYVWDLQHGAPPKQLVGHISFVNDLRFDESSNYLVSCSGDQTVRIWDVTLAEGRIIVGSAKPYLRLEKAIPFFTIEDWKADKLIVLDRDKHKKTLELKTRSAEPIYARDASSSSSLQFEVINCSLVVWK